MSASDSDQKSTSTFWPKTAANWLEFMLKVLVITGSIGGIYQYFDVKQENRVKKTMEFLDNFNSGNLQSAQLNLSEFWEGYHAKIRQLNQATVENEEARTLILERIVLPVISHNKQQKDIDLMVGFFENLQVCIVGRICEEHTTKIFFGSYAASFFNLYEPWIKRRREIIPNYACQLQFFARQVSCQ